jgi:hypothetical protein
MVHFECNSVEASTLKFNVASLEKQFQESTMRKAMLGSLFGLLVGSALGTLLAFTFHRMEEDEQPEKGLTTFPANISGPMLWQHARGNTPLSNLLFHGLLLGGGFGSVVGAISAATEVITRTLGQTKSR